MVVNATAMNFEVYYSKAIHYTLMVTAASFMQVPPTLIFLYKSMLGDIRI